MNTSAKQKLILVADDDPAIVDAIKMILEYADYRVETTVDGTVIPKMKTLQPDLLLLDIWMSGVDGRDICKQLKNDTSVSAIPIIMISASKDVSASSKEAGADDFIAKPFEMDHLLKKVEEHIH